MSKNPLLAGTRVIDLSRLTAPATMPAIRLPIRFDNTIPPSGESPRLGADNESILGAPPPRQPHPI
jgi:hypothetical protein